MTAPDPSAPGQAEPNPDTVDADAAELGFDLADIPGATRWSSIAPEKADAAWLELAEWVEGLQARFAHLDHHVVPACWWRHNEHVEALVALRDHERIAFSSTAPATAPVDWFRALRDIGALLRSWTADAGCGSTHQTPMATRRPPAKDDPDWRTHVAADVGDRRRRASTAES